MKRWTKEEIDYLIKNWKKVSLENMIIFLCRTKDSIERKARYLGLDVRKNKEDLLKKKWSYEEDQFVLDNYLILTVKEISKKLNRTVYSIRKRYVHLGISETIRKWSLEEEEYLIEKWGFISVSTIAKNLNRTYNSVLLKAYQLSLRKQASANGSFFTPLDIRNILNVSIRSIYFWLENKYLEAKRLVVGKKRKYQITHKDFILFLKNNQDKWSTLNSDMDTINSLFSKYNIYKSGEIHFKRIIPKWLISKIDLDNSMKYFKRGVPWTTQEEIKLIELYFIEGLSYKEIEKILNRTYQSIKTKICSLKRKKPEYITSIITFC